MKSIMNLSAMLVVSSLSGCSDDTDRPPDADVVIDTLSPSDATTDGASGPDVSTDDVVDTDLPEATTAFQRSVAVDWVIQSAGGHMEMLAGIGLADGGVAFVANFNGTVTWGLKSVTAPTTTLNHTLFGRIDASGEAVVLERLCDGCGGMGPFVLAEMPFGRIGVAATSTGDVVLNPGIEGETRHVATQDLFVGVISAQGRLQRWNFVGTFAGRGAVGALAAGADDGLIVAGSGRALTIVDGPQPSVSASDAPGRAFLVGLDHDLIPIFAEQLDGDASSGIHLLHVVGDSLVAVGDFGGWRDMRVIFGAGVENATALEVVSATEDPANDLFVSRWTLPVERAERPAPTWARRIAHRSDAPRLSTWIRAIDGSSHDGGFEFRLDRAGALSSEAAVPGATASLSVDERLVVRLSGSGNASAGATTVAPIQPRPNGNDLLPDGAADGYVSVAIGADAETLRLRANGGPEFVRPVEENGTWEGLVVAEWLTSGSPLEAGLLPVRRATEAFTTSLHGAFPQPDGSVVVILASASALTLAPTGRAPIALVHAASSKRLIVARIRLS